VAFTERHWRGEVLAALVGGAGTAVTMLMYGSNEFGSVVFGVVATIISFILLMVGTAIWNAFRAPFLLWGEQKRRIEALESRDSDEEYVRELIRDLREFMTDRASNEPSPFDPMKMNFDLSDQGIAEFGEGAAFNLVIPEGADENLVRMIKNAQDERFNYEKATIEEYSDKFYGRVVAAADLFAERDLISEQDQNTLNGMPLAGNSTNMLRDYLNILRKSAERLNRAPQSATTPETP